MHFIEAESVPQNNTAIFISKYAKVAHWGMKENGTKPDNLERRSGQSLWAHRSDANLVSGQNLKSDKPRVIYQYPVYKKQSKVSDDNVERLPAVGEVIQDRYNPRPYFGYTKIPPKSEESATYGAPKPTQSSDTNLDSFPAVFNVAPSTPQSVDLYTSPYSSYNPPPVMIQNHAVTDNYPPSIEDTYGAPPPSDNQGPYDYNVKVPQDIPTPSYASLGPPLAPDNIPSIEDHKNHNVDAPPSDHMSMQHSDGFPPYPPKDEGDIYYPPDVPDSGRDHSPKDFLPAPDMGMSMDQPPPSDHGRFPQYLYDSHHFDHHVYEEIPHTTTEAVEDKRVSGGHYSYYYLGRKLWYVPLYFSIYFMIYVAVLILKAIARHKVQYKHKFVTSQMRESRKLGSDQQEYVDNVTRNVTNAMDKAQKNVPIGYVIYGFY
ncbi:hypothetical protein NQ315_015070 [Exocentrus adspersus]|uniref:Uncharacterized protein n=1 Tax=Exocentrus adspersus TaxID=1586481 RepID=A0AAV8VX66_9CUCU|nr:hypothetical protein NQ315_015070 [Exocentrus adspersus]